MTPVLFELGARPHPPRALYRSYLEQSHVFVGIYWERHGWVAPGETVSGLEDEYRLSVGMPRLVYVKEPAPGREPALDTLLDLVRSDDTVSYKHFATADELRELVAADLALLISERFQSVASQSRVRDLPARATSFVGRTGELAEIERVLTGSARLVTLTGPGGIGKTRLAVEAADRLRDLQRNGVAFVPLEGLESAGLVPAAISAALGLRDAGPDPLASAAAHLHHRSLLLVLDNFEHVVAAAPAVGTLLEAAPELRVLVTSREVLRLRGEHELRVPPLVPDADGAELFAERAAAYALRDDDAETVAEICRRLDGVPLAIELAAPRLRLMTPKQLLDGLRERIALTGPRDAPARQRTLEAAIASSYELLEPTERGVFERLSVFRGSFTFESAAAVCDLEQGDVVELLASLLDKSVVYRLPEGTESRFAMLSMLREFAHERLVESGALDAAFEGLTSYYVELAERAQPGFRSSEQRSWKLLIDLEADTVRAELAWLNAHDRSDELATLLRGVWLWFWLNGRIDEGHAWIRDALAYEDELALEQRAWLVCLDGLFAFFQLDLAVAHAQLARAGAWFEESDDLIGVATTGAIAGFVAGPVAGEAAALSLLQKSLETFESIDDAWGTAVTLGTICRTRVVFGSLDGADELFARALAISEEVGDDLQLVLALTNCADYEFFSGAHDASRRHIERALALMDEAGVRYGAPDVLESLARLEAAAGRHAVAAELVGTADALRELMRLPVWGPLAERRESFVEELRAALGEDSFEASHATGSATEFDRWLVPA